MLVTEASRTPASYEETSALGYDTPLMFSPFLSPSFMSVKKESKRIWLKAHLNE